MPNSALSPQDKAYHHAIGRILNAHVSELYPLTTEFFKLNEAYFDQLVIFIDQANIVMVDKMHEGWGVIQAREYAVELAYEACQEKFSPLEEDFEKQKKSTFDINASGYIDSTLLN